MRMNQVKVGDIVVTLNDATGNPVFRKGAMGEVIATSGQAYVMVRFQWGEYNKTEGKTCQKSTKEAATGGYVTVECANLKYWFTEESYKKLQGLRYSEFTFSNHAVFVYDRARDKFVKARWNLEEVIDTYMKGI